MTVEVELLLSAAARDRLTGCVEVHFQDGTIRLLKRIEWIRPPGHSDAKMNEAPSATHKRYSS